AAVPRNPGADLISVIASNPRTPSRRERPRDPARSGAPGEQLVELLLVLVIAEHGIELVARLHAVDQLALRPVATQRHVNGLCGGRHGAERAERIEHETHASVSQL